MACRPTVWALVGDIDRRSNSAGKNSMANVTLSAVKLSLGFSVRAETFGLKLVANSALLCSSIQGNKACVHLFSYSLKVICWIENGNEVVGSSLEIVLVVLALSRSISGGWHVCGFHLGRAVASWKPAWQEGNWPKIAMEGLQWIQLLVGDGRVCLSSSSYFF
ncbi:hypothetical protein HPP92_003655 [Vanilla planifolia]|uniref:Uncharacterized protein n=1 Tax=Vanilla planifolia TaxID=51239 RepID=A0A835SH39_VANPL|nr:hypothetical protein HPP92_003655 [Vanilla planifolia]